MKYIFLVLFVLLTVSCKHDPDPIPQPVPTVNPTVTHTIAPPVTKGDRVWGLTIDNIDKLDQIVNSVGAFKAKTTVRIVFDEGNKSSYYQEATTKLSQVANVMGELLDSYYVKDFSLDQYKARTNDFILNLPKVDIWEIGNEVNGEWLNSGAINKVVAAFDIAKANNKKTALTLYYNQDCWEKPANEMFKWTETNVPDRMKQGLDYVLVSYYEDDCNNRILTTSQWEAVFDRLNIIFPNSKLGMGEVGTKYSDRKEAYMKRYYLMQLSNPKYIGGYFWWYGYQDLIPSSKPLWSVFNNLISN